MTKQSDVLLSAGSRHDSAPVVLIVVLAALAVFFFVLNPRFVEIHARAQAQLAKEVAHENAVFCEKRGLAAATSAYTECVDDLNKLRAGRDKRTQESVFGLL